MTVPAALLVCPALALGIAALRRRNRMFSGPWSETAAEFLVPLLLGILAYCYYQTLLLNGRWGWSASRLAPTIGLFHGYPLYSPIDTGPINGWIHGPVAPLVWAPAALAGSPLPALCVAGIINLLFLLSPLWVGSRLFPAGPGSSQLLGFVFGAGGLLLIYPTWYMASVLCSDAIAVGLGLGSCFVLLADPAPGTRHLAMAAILAALAAWTKQTEAPLVIAQLGWLGLVHGRKCSLAYGALCAASLLAVAALVFGMMVPRDVILNMWTIPSSQKLTGTWSAAWQEFVAFGGYSLLFSVPCLLALVLTARSFGGNPPRPRSFQAVVLLLSVAAIMLPLGLMASIKIGGDRNSVHSVYYLAAAAALAFSQAWSSAKVQTGLWRAALLLASAVTACLAARQVSSYSGLSMLPSRCLSQESWVFAQQHPWETYFAQDPLATVMAEGRMYHFDYAVLDREYAGITPSQKHIRECLPVNMNAVVYPRTTGAQTVLKQFLPEFVFSKATDAFIIFRRPSPK